MAYSKEACEKAIAILEKRQKKSEIELKEKKAYIYAKIPRLKEIDKQMAKTTLIIIKELAQTKNGNIHDLIENVKQKNLKLQQEKENILKNFNEIPKDFFKAKYLCNLCNDTGYTKSGMCGCFKNLIVNEVSKNLNIRLPLDKFSFSNFDINLYDNTLVSGIKEIITRRELAQNNLNYCIKYANNFSDKSDNLFMQGATGLGKTHLSLAIAQSCIKKVIGVIYILAGQLIYGLEDERFRKDERKGYTMNSLLECELLIIDDLGAEPQNQFALNSIYNIINSRLMYLKPTIINTNLTANELNNRYSQRLTSRIFGEYKVLKFFGFDIRITKMKKKNETFF